MNFSPLIEILGKEKCLSDVEDRYIYRSDTTRVEGMPELVVNITDKKDIIETVLFAKKHNIPIIPRGSGTGMSGGVVALRGGIILNFEGMDHIGEVDRFKRSIVVEAGAVTADIQKKVSKEGFYFPPDPSSYKVSTIGGNIGENAGGLHCVKYGVTSRYVKGLRYIDCDGNDCSGGSLAKEYNPLSAMVIGSEGTLGIVYEVELDLIEEPISSRLYLIYLNSFEDGVEFVVDIKKSGVTPSMMEIIDESAFEAVNMYKPVDTPEGVSSVILMEIDGYSATEIYKRRVVVEELLEKRSLTYKSSSDRGEKDELNTIRRSISPAVRMISPNKMNEDIVIPITRFKEMINYIRGISRSTGVRIPIYGHAGDGNLHVNILYDKRKIKEVEKASNIAELIFKKCTELGGSITGEHGVGIAKKGFLRIQYGVRELNLFRDIKEGFDPEYRVNPDKIFNRD